MFDCVRKLVAGITGRRKTEPNRTPRIIGPEEHGIDPDKVSWAARRTCEILQARGFKAFVVGGAVRDLLLGVTPKDFDVATDAEPEQVKRAQRRAYIIGKRFRLVHVVFGDEIIECSTFRALDAAGVRKDANGRVVSDNVFGEMWEDAARRDFTINAMYYDPTTQQVYDYHGGFEDLKKRRLVMIGDPVERYREDPVRMMRAVRIAAKLGFTMDRDTERAIPKMARTLENVPAARLFDEMMKLFTSGHAEACLIKLRADGYIEKNSRSGYHVYAIQLKDYVDFFEFRLILEPQAAYLAARNMSDAQLQLLQDNLNKYRKAIAEQDLPAVVSLDNQFHDTIIEGSNNAYLIEVFKIYQTKKMFFAQKLIRADRLRNMENKHFALYRALCDSDEEKACEIMRSHLSFYIKNLYGII